MAIDKGRTVVWHTPETLAQLLRRHRVDDSVNKAIGKLIRSCAPAQGSIAYAHRAPLRRSSSARARPARNQPRTVPGGRPRRSASARCPAARDRSSIGLDHSETPTARTGRHRAARAAGSKAGE
jgi:hypothetical protein